MHVIYMCAKIFFSNAFSATSVEILFKIYLQMIKRINLPWANPQSNPFLSRAKAQLGQAHSLPSPASTGPMARGPAGSLPIPFLSLSSRAQAAAARLLRARARRASAPCPRKTKLSRAQNPMMPAPLSSSANDKFVCPSRRLGFRSPPHKPSSESAKTSTRHLCTSACPSLVPASSYPCPALLPCQAGSSATSSTAAASIHSGCRHWHGQPPPQLLHHTGTTSAAPSPATTAW